MHYESQKSTSFMVVTRLLSNLARLFEDNSNHQKTFKASGIDRRSLREEEAKRKGEVLVQ